LELLGCSPNQSLTQRAVAARGAPSLSWDRAAALIDSIRRKADSALLRALKLVDLRDGRFQTVLPSVDPRLSVSFGAMGPPAPDAKPRQGR
jgi:hypothetical protein